MSTTSEPVSWEVPIPEVSKTTSAIKSPVQKRLEASTIFWQQQQYQAPPPLQLPERLQQHEERRQAQLNVQVKLNSEHVDRAKRIAKQKQLERQHAKDKLAQEIELKLIGASMRRQHLMDLVKSRAIVRRNYLHHNTERQLSPKKHCSSNCLERISKAEERRNKRHEGIVNRAKSHLERVERKRLRVRYVKIVQAWWRRHVKIAAFAQSNPKDLCGILFFGHSTCREMLQTKQPFEELAMHLRNPSVADAAAKLLKAIKAVTQHHVESVPKIKVNHVLRRSPKVVNRKSVPKQTTKRSSGRKSVSNVALLRTFLSSIMLVCHPSIVLGIDSGSSDEDKRLANELKLASENMLVALEKVCMLSSSYNSNLTKLAKSFMKNRLLFERQFTAWKRRDAKKLASEMQSSYVSVRLNTLHLERNVFQVDPHAIHDPGALQMKTGLEKQEESLKKRVKQLIGPTNFESWLTEAEAKVDEILQLESQTVGTEVEPEIEPEPVTSDAPPNVPYQATHLPSNVEMVHEITLNKEYKITKLEKKYPWIPQGNDMDAVEAMQEQLQQHNHTYLMKVLAEIRDRVGNLTPNRPDLKSSLEDHFNIDLLKQQFERGAFDRHNFQVLLQYIGERVISLQAAAREADTRAWLQRLSDDISASVDMEWLMLVPVALDRLLQTIAQIELDMANYHLSLLSSSLPRSEATKYIEEKFLEQYATLESSETIQVFGLPQRTVFWIRSSIHSLRTGPLHRQTNAIAADECVMEGILNLIFDEPTVELPEIVEFCDSNRISTLQANTKRIAKLGVLEVVVQQLVGVQFGLRLAPAGKESTEMEQLLYTYRQQISDCLCLNTTSNIEETVMAIMMERITATLKSHDETQDDSKLSTIQDQLEVIVRQMMSKNEANQTPLLGVITRRIVTTLRKTDTKNKSFSTQLERVGLLPWKEELIAMSKEIHSMQQLYLDVYGKRIIQCLEAEEASQ